MRNPNIIRDHEIVTVACDAMMELEFFRLGKDQSFTAVQKICDLLQDFAENESSDPTLFMVFRHTLRKCSAEFLGMPFEQIKKIAELRSVIKHISLELSTVLLQPLVGIPENIEALRDFCIALTQSAICYYSGVNKHYLLSA